MKGIVLLANQPVFEVRDQVVRKHHMLMYKRIVPPAMGLVPASGPDPWATMGTIMTDADVFKEVGDDLVPMTPQEKVACAVRKALEDYCLQLSCDYPPHLIDTVVVE